MTRLLLIRHGESEANRAGVFAGHIDPDLQWKGVKQAELTAEYVAANYSVDKIYSSDLKRAYRTAQALADKLGMEIIADTRLREIDGGKWENVKFEEIVKLYPEEFGIWINDIENAVCPDGESVAALGERIMGVLEEIAVKNDGKTVVIATHATPVRVAQSIIQNGGLRGMKDIPYVSNASVSHFEYDGGWKIVKAGEDAHLAGLRTSLPHNI